MADAVAEITDGVADALGQVTAVADDAEVAVAPIDDDAIAGAETDIPWDDLSPAEQSALYKNQVQEHMNFRSMTDRHMNEMREAQKASKEDLKAIAEAMMAQSEATRSLAPQAPAADPKAVYAELGERLMPDDPEQGAKIAQMMDELGGKWVGKMESLVDSRLGETRSQMRTLDPDYRQHKESVDELVSGGMSPEAAIAYVKKHAVPPKGAAAVQPGSRSLPGRVATAASGVQTDANRPEALALDANMANAMRMAYGSIGVKDPMKRVQQIARAGR